MGPEGNRSHPMKSSLMQAVMTVIANTAVLSSGMTLGFTAVALPHLEKPNDLLHLTKDESSWIASCVSLALPVGCLMSGPMMDRWGRRIALLFSCFPAALGWVIMGADPTMRGLLVGRILTGFATGISSTPATVFVAEISSPALRGFLTTGTSIAIACGITLVYLFGLFLQSDWRMVCWACLSFPIAAAVVLMVWMPESATWLVSRGKTEEAAEALARARGTTPDSKEVTDALADVPLRPRRNAASFKCLLEPKAMKPFLVMNIFFLFQQVTGIFVVIFYAVDVVKEAGVSLDPYIVAVLIGLTRLLFTILGGWMSRAWGRRPCSLISGIGMTTSLLLLAGHLFIQANYTDVATDTAMRSDLPPEVMETLNYTDRMNLNSTSLEQIEETSVIPVIAILVYILTSTIGFLTLPWAMLAEVYPIEVRGIASGLTTSIAYIVSGVTVKLYPVMMDAMGKHGLFLFYGIMALLGTVFVAIFLPETQGKTLTEIEEYFAGKSRRKADEEEELNMTKMVTIVPAKTNQTKP